MEKFNLSLYIINIKLFKNIEIFEKYFIKNN